MRPDSAMSDAELIRLFWDDHTREAAYTAIVRKYQERLYWHIRRIVITHEDADDVLQNTFIKVWSGLDSFREESHLYTWLYRIATNECNSFLLHRKRKNTEDLAAFSEYLGERIKGEDNFDANRIEWKLQLALKELPYKQLLVFNLRYFEEMPYSEMSKILDTSEGALKASYHHAVRKVTSYLKENI